MTQQLLETSRSDQSRVSQWPCPGLVSHILLNDAKTWPLCASKPTNAASSPQRAHHARYLLRTRNVSSIDPESGVNRGI